MFSFRWPVVGVKSAMSGQKHVEFRVLPISHSGLQKKTHCHGFGPALRNHMNVSEDIENLKVVCPQYCNFNICSHGKIVIYHVIFWGTLFSDKPKNLSCTCALGVTLRVMLFRLHVGVFSQPWEWLCERCAKSLGNGSPMKRSQRLCGGRVKMSGDALCLFVLHRAWIP